MFEEGTYVKKNCAKDKICAHCGNKNVHHKSLCPTLFPDSDSSLSSIEDSVEAKPTEGTKTYVLMQAATTTVKNIKGSSSMLVCLILDPGSQRIYVTKKLAKELKLNIGPSKTFQLLRLVQTSLQSFNASQSNYGFI